MLSEPDSTNGHLPDDRGNISVYIRNVAAETARTKAMMGGAAPVPSAIPPSAARGSRPDEPIPQLGPGCGPWRDQPVESAPPEVTSDPGRMRITPAARASRAGDYRLFVRDQLAACKTLDDAIRCLRTALLTDPAAFGQDAGRALHERLDRAEQLHRIHGTDYLAQLRALVTAHEVDVMRIAGLLEVAAALEKNNWARLLEGLA